jgi:glycosyltransferase involved in cell wall biosynthesis
MKVCIVGNDYKQQFPLLEYGGIEAAFQDVCIGTNKYFKDIKFCAFVPKILLPGSDDYGFKIIETETVETSKTGHPAHLFGNEVRDIIKKGNIKPDIIWCYSAWSVQTLHDLNIPIICTIMDSGGWEDNKFLYKENIHYRFSSKYIYDLVFKDADTNPRINNIKKQSCWFITGASDEEYDFEENKSDYILWTAGLNWGPTAKGLDIFIKLARLRTDRSFVAYGSGNLEIENRLKELNCELNNFYYGGPLPRGFIHKNAFSKAKMFAFLTQIPEAFGRTGLEAITKGTPVLGSTKGAVPELYGPAGKCTDSLEEMSKIIDMTFDTKEVFNYAQKFHIKNEVQFLIDKSVEIIGK